MYKLDTKRAQVHADVRAFAAAGLASEWLAIGKYAAPHLFCAGAGDGRRRAGARAKRGIAVQDRVVRLAGCALRAVSEPWGFAQAAAGEIDEHWRRRSAESSQLFNGTILLMRAWRIEGEALVARFSPAEFKPGAGSMGLSRVIGESPRFLSSHLEDI